MADSTIDPTAITQSQTGLPFATAVVTQITAAKADIEGLTAASLSATTPSGPGTGAVGDGTTAARSNHVHPPQSVTIRIDDAAASDELTERVIAEFKGATTITAVKFAADAAVTQDDTDYATITVKQGDGAGGARSSVASKTSKTTGGANFAAFSAVSLGAITNAVVPAAGIVTLTTAKAGAGQQLNGLLVIEFS